MPGNITAQSFCHHFGMTGIFLQSGFEKQEPAPKKSPEVFTEIFSSHPKYVQKFPELFGTRSKTPAQLRHSKFKMEKGQTCVDFVSLPGGQQLTAGVSLTCKDTGKETPTRYKNGK